MGQRRWRAHARAGSGGAQACTMAASGSRSAAPVFGKMSTQYATDKLAFVKVCPPARLLAHQAACPAGCPPIRLPGHPFATPPPTSPPSTYIHPIGPGVHLWLQVNVDQGREIGSKCSVLDIHGSLSRYRYSYISSKCGTLPLINQPFCIDTNTNIKQSSACPCHMSK